MVKPKPVPSARRSLSPTCSKGWKICANSSGRMPTPVSLTEKCKVTSLSTERLISLTVKFTLPRSVNLTALLKRLSKTCRSRFSSAWIAWGRVESGVYSSKRSFSIARIRTRSIIVLKKGNSFSSPGFNSNLRASIFAKSRISLIRVSRCCPLCSIISKPLVWRGVSLGVRFKIWA